MFQSPYIPGIAVPLLFICIGAVSKKLVRGSPFSRSDFFMGIELTLAAMSAQLLYLFEIAQITTGQQGSVASDLVLGTAVFLAITLFCLVGLLALHQTYESNSNSAKEQYIALTFSSNVIGGLLILLFVVVVKG